tara:strand:- start:712 stop:1095 length:384 start_codon:yes stop_codon:yes gene_type:complete
MNYRNAKHISEGRIDCEIEHPMHGWIPYTLNPADIKNDDLLASMALADDVAAYVPPTQAELDAELAKQIRADRGALLLELDVFVCNPLRWAALDADTQAAWAVYRQELLDVPQQAGFPNDAVWPVKP